MVKAHQQHEPNVAILQLIIGGRHWYVVGCYLVPHKTSTLERVVAAICQQPQGAELLISGDFNADLSVPDGHDWYKKIVEMMEKEVLGYMMESFFPRNLLWARDGRTWRIILRGQEVRSRMD